MNEGCWSGWCIASYCDGIDHVDATGYTWTEKRPTPQPAQAESAPADAATGR